MILTDGTHLISDKSVEELHTFASNLGLKCLWFQNHRSHPHYDLTTRRMSNKAILHGAVLVSSVEIVKKCHIMYDP